MCSSELIGLLNQVDLMKSSLVQAHNLMMLDKNRKEIEREIASVETFTKMIEKRIKHLV
jgi:hypothetical protein|tara:strand:+ start:661 stop:837 length:177 start_codon:yes stop_codon:yes gene_type:complete